MDKRKSLIIATIVSLAIIFIVYIGVFRYFKTSLSPMRSLVLQYKDLPPASKKGEKTVIALSLSKSRKEKQTVKSILDQTVRVTEIITVSCPGMEISKEDYIRDVAVQVPCGKNYGEITALVSALIREKDCNAIIIALKNDVFYGGDFIENLLELHHKTPEKMLIGNNFILAKPNFFGCIITEDSDYTIDILTEKAQNGFTIINERVSSEPNLPTF